MQPLEVPSVNDAYIREVYLQYLADPDSVPPEWRQYFESQRTNGRDGLTLPAQSQPGLVSAVPSDRPSWLLPTDELLPLDGVAERIAQNMARSLTVPTATSFRAIPVKLLEENRWLANRYLQRRSQPKLSFTHFLAWAVVQALKRYPHLNDACATVGGRLYRVRRHSLNLGIAVDVVRKDGSRSLLVPVIRDAQTLSFSEFVRRYDELVERARTGRLTIEELTGATVSLTNPGMLGTVMSVPRLPEGQGLIVATGAIAYPAELRATPAEILAQVTLGKVLVVTSTYDHRIIQGAESGEFLAFIEQLLLGTEGFYESIFGELRLPMPPFRWAEDTTVEPGVKEERLAQLIRSYRVRGHLIAQTNPLRDTWDYHPDLDPAHYGFTIWDLDRHFHTGGVGEYEKATLRQVLEVLWDSYCGPIAVEFMHIQDPERRRWIQERMERLRHSIRLSDQQRRRVYQKLLEAEIFEQFLHRKFVGHKRFSLEGGESLLPLLDTILQRAIELGLEYAVIGMAHRGRLNVLANIVGKSFRRIFDEFEGEADPLSFHGSGDVKYHLGARGLYVHPTTGQSLQLILASNPSHLEAVDPVVEGMARALQDQLGDRDRRRVLPILIHGDAAFAGQGIVAETLNLSKLAGYTTGGTVHIIVNNQIGFTTEPVDARSMVYPTDVAKMVQAPIFHVNGDDPEAVVTAALLALEYRMNFHEDAVIDLFCYRKYGHNEADEPTYTQPLLYRRIRHHPSVRQLYKERLLREGILTEAEERQMADGFLQQLNTAFSERRPPSVTSPPQRTAVTTVLQPVMTAVPRSELQAVAAALGRVPEDFHLHPKLQELIRYRATALERGVDWATAELLAFGTLLLEGFPVRLSGQDSRRGTFSQRHAVLIDVETEREYIPLNHILPQQRAFLEIYDSPLSELAVLGFEYGYSIQTLHGLTIWEAQFGDFSNGAQVIIDQFISSGEAKWGQQSNLVLLLPHGYEGQGPEHSSARIERYLQLCADGNMYVCIPTTPAQYFHLLRRQLLSPVRKPLVVLTPKSLLRHPMVVSPVTDLVEGSFQEVLDDPLVGRDPSTVRTILLCSGKVFYELWEYRKLHERWDTALIRVEQLFPIHTEKLFSVLRCYPAARRIVWVQEEPQNMGAWSHMALSLGPVLHANFGWDLSYVGRPAGASPATGSFLFHEQEQRRFIEACFS
ncbi:MAG: multifunctional oxoglutarate decarboxylase/oxoglutarate dehydrogenase thiamine pyrophosphate-binding subunit/dihydrolipoyllysine-residue succinyltransferase subunit [Candidatus Kapabacteria bacterium]|nr:multifunctional oxoglutarate decarboxylase/oxoglutarate dehydrogenase thiamine pyrophosphate-binding subunit/dihydrolipoyllysine-residue succinyltransferase subunit [Candidatus Kapabacteria bacterium]MDW8012350.1 multifunctional oxoglutarate decarboxylase/oxoglutarate dehydrogenase thiamine pyrophosphate-binding subunit/dihydrolipoyllysine-residue succinyltransferase subunit [Bacteroidota bacterium]